MDLRAFLLKSLTLAATPISICRAFQQRRARQFARSQFHRPAFFESALYSQNGEDGIIKEVFFRIGASKKFFVEIGAGDGAESTATALGLLYNWSGLMIEADEDKCFRLAEAFRANQRVAVKRAFVTKENVGELLASAQTPQDFDLLVIDIDGNDYWIWSSLRQYRPKLVIIEYNQSFPPPMKRVMQYAPLHAWDGLSNYFGASLQSLVELAESMDYALIGTDKRGINAFFLRSDLIAAACFPPVTAVQAYHRWLPLYLRRWLLSRKKTFLEI